MRAAANRAADLSSGGFALVFATTDGPSGDLRLRAASGFAQAEQAQNAASALLPAAVNTVQKDVVTELPAPAALDGRAAGGLRIVPLRHGETVHGALATASPAPPLSLPS